MTQRTAGVSPKAKLAALLPVVGTLILALLDQFLSPSIDPTVKVAIVGLVNAVLAFAGAYAGKPGNVVSDERSSWGAEAPQRATIVLGAPTNLANEVPAGSVPIPEDPNAGNAS